ncbi:unnamed protein product [Closterium sp. NIES-65]|nr:unnamed protein product [Closterium sp. NIES-65]
MDDATTGEARMEVDEAREAEGGMTITGKVEAGEAETQEVKEGETIAEGADAGEIAMDDKTGNNLAGVATAGETKMAEAEAKETATEKVEAGETRVDEPEVEKTEAAKPEETKAEDVLVEEINTEEAKGGEAVKEDSPWDLLEIPADGGPGGNEEKNGSAAAGAGAGAPAPKGHSTASPASGASRAMGADLLRAACADLVANSPQRSLTLRELLPALKSLNRADLAPALAEVIGAAEGRSRGSAHEGRLRSVLSADSRFTIQGMGNSSTSRMCHQCQRNDKETITICSKVHTHRFCGGCIRNWYPYLTPEEIHAICPKCLGVCNCKTCLRTFMPPPFKAESSPEQQRGMARWVLAWVMPHVRAMQKEQQQEVEEEAARQAIDPSSLKVKRAELLKGERIFCSHCQTGIAGLHRSCPKCAYDLCLQCCREARSGALPGGPKAFKGMVEQENAQEKEVENGAEGEKAEESEEAEGKGKGKSRKNPGGKSSSRRSKRGAGKLGNNGEADDKQEEKQTGKQPEKQSDGRADEKGREGVPKHLVERWKVEDDWRVQCPSKDCSSAREARRQSEGQGGQGPWLELRSLHADGWLTQLVAQAEEALGTDGERKSEEIGGTGKGVVKSSGCIDAAAVAAAAAAAQNAQVALGSIPLIAADQFPCCSLCQERATQVLQEMTGGTSSSGGNLAPAPAASPTAAGNSPLPIGHNPPAVAHFQQHWQRGEPIIVRHVMPPSVKDGLSWAPLVMWRAFRETKEGRSVQEKLTVVAVDCEDCTEVELGTHLFFDCYMNGESKSAKVPEMLKVKDWPPTAAFQDRLPRHGAEFLRALPLHEYTHPEKGLLNLATAVPTGDPKADMGPKAYIAYGVREELVQGDSVTKLHFDMADAVSRACGVNILTHCHYRPPSKRLQGLMRKNAEGNAAEGNAAEAGHENGVATKSESEKNQEGSNGKGRGGGGGSEPQQQAAGSASGRVLTAGGDEGAALWDIFRREDSDKIRAFIARHLHEFRHLHNQVIQSMDDEIHDQTVYLTARHKEMLYTEYGVEAWTFEQRRGEAVFIPAGCAHQVRNLMSNMKVAVDFVSPEGTSHCLALTAHVRTMPVHHRSKEDRLEVKRMILHAVERSLAILK